MVDAQMKMGTAGSQSDRELAKFQFKLARLQVAKVKAVTKKSGLVGEPKENGTVPGSSV